jgi:hypothetical protein
MSKPWRKCKAAVKLMSQINLAAPERDTTTDGAIGDAQHATRNSDHNPWVIDRSGQPVVTAQDIDEDLNVPGWSMRQLVDAICRSKDPRVKYIIYEGRITVKGSNLQRWKKYEGKNAHSQHAHISFASDQRLYDDDGEWAIGAPVERSEPEETYSAAALSTEGPEPPTEDIAGKTLPEDEPTSFEQPPPIESGQQLAAGSKQPEHFPAYVPQIDTSKSWLQRMFAGTTIGAAISIIAGAPFWLQVSMVAMVFLVVIAAIVIFIKYHEQIFAYVGKMNTLRATPGMGNPLVSGRPPRM